MSTLNWIEGKNGIVQGSIVDAENDLIYQFHNDIEGSLVTTVTKSSDFGEELEPPNAPDRQLMSEVDQDGRNIHSAPDSSQKVEELDQGHSVTMVIFWM